MSEGRPQRDSDESAEPSSGSLTSRALRGAAWAGAAQLIGKLLFFISTVVLARVLHQDDFGVAAYAVTLIALIGAIPALGLGPALIYHAEDDRALSTGFWIALGVSILAFGAVWALAPLTEHLFHDPRSIDVTRALAAVFPIQALRIVHSTILRKRLAFKRRFVPELTQSIAKGGVSIVLALAGFGYWALIFGTLSGAAASVVAYWIVTRWRPLACFDLATARNLIGFGAHVVGVDLMGAVIRNSDNLLVGRLLGPVALGVYVLAFRIPDLLVRNLCQMLGQVLLPVYAKVRQDRQAVHSAFIATLGYMFAITAPVSLGLALVAEPLVLTLFEEKWAAVIPVMVPICVYALLASVTYNFGDLYKAMGRPDVLSRIGVLRVATVLPLVYYGAAVVGTPAAVAWGQAGAEVIALVVNLFVATRVFGLPVGQALARTRPIVASVLVLGLVTAGALSATREWPELARLLVSSTAGAAAYFVALRILARPFFDDGVDAITTAMGRRRLVRQAAQ